MKTKNMDKNLQLSTCNLCKYTARDERELEDHIRSHILEKPYKCSHVNCSFSTGQSSSLRNHKRMHTNSKTIFECQLCPYKTNDKYCLKGHMINIHEGNPAKPLECDYPNCSYKTKRRGHLNAHISHVHATERKYKCTHDGCSYAAKDMETLSRHKNTHITEKNIKCPHPQCEYRTTHKRNLGFHLRIHRAPEEKEWKCLFCSYTAHFRTTLNSHMRKHTKETPYKCGYPDCDYQGKVKDDLTRHNRKHSDSRPFKCPFKGCSYAAKCRDDRDKHTRIHKVDSSIFKCPVKSCSFTSKWNSSLNKHLERKHKDIPRNMVFSQGKQCIVPLCNFIRGENNVKEFAKHLTLAHNLPRVEIVKLEDD